MKTFSKYIISKLLECRNYINKYENKTIKSDISHNNCDIIAVGDIHGDIQLMIDTLTIGGVIKETNAQNNNAIQIIRKDKNDKDEYYEWIGKNTIVVQVGDQIDRCRPTNFMLSNCKEQNVTYDDEASDIEILLFFTNLHEKAYAVGDGSAVYSLLGNHELMNIHNDIRYVSYKNLEQLKLEENEEIDNEVKEIMTSENNNIENNNIDDYIKRRSNIFRREGILAKFIACTRYSILIVNGYLFVHGGVLGSYINQNNYKNKFQDLNNKIKDYLIKKQNKNLEKEIKGFIFRTNSPFYTRKLGKIKIDAKIDDKHCKDVKNIINHYGIKGIIVGHTPQPKGINGTCLENDNKTLFRIDVASSKAFHLWPDYNLQAQVLKISKNNTFTKIKKDGKEVSI
jgi:hypothetical protein